MPRARVNGIELDHESTGTGAPMVWEHGFGCGILSWDPQVRVADLRGLLEHLGIRAGVGAAHRRGTPAAALSCICGVHANSFPKGDPT